MLILTKHKITDLLSAYFTFGMVSGGDDSDSYIAEITYRLSAYFYVSDDMPEMTMVLILT